MEQTYEGDTYTLTDDKPNNNDKVLTDGYGVWRFFDEGGGTAPLPYWANHKTCKKIIAINGKEI